MDNKFIDATRNNKLREFYAAYRILDDTSTPVLKSVCDELLIRAKYLYLMNKYTGAESVAQFAAQIMAVLSLRGNNVEAINSKIVEMLHLV